MMIVPLAKIAVFWRFLYLLTHYASASSKDRNALLPLFSMIALSVIFGFIVLFAFRCWAPLKDETSQESYCIFALIMALVDFCLNFLPQELFPFLLFAETAIVFIVAYKCFACTFRRALGLSGTVAGLYLLTLIAVDLIFC